MEKETLIIVLFFMFMIGAGVGFYVMSFIF